jgi:hypothetical protein
MGCALVTVAPQAPIPAASTAAATLAIMILAKWIIYREYHIYYRV